MTQKFSITNDIDTKVAEIRENFRIDPEKRRAKLSELMAKGLNDNEIMSVLDISRATFYRDLGKLRDYYKSTHYQNFATVRILEIKEQLLQDVMAIYRRPTSDIVRLRALTTANNLLNSLERTYERMGLIPSLKYQINIQTQNNWLTQIKMEAYETLKKEKKGKKRPEMSSKQLEPQM